jgi:hypothetical protein
MRHTHHEDDLGSDDDDAMSLALDTVLLLAQRFDSHIEGFALRSTPSPENKDALSPLSYSVVTIFMTVRGGAGAEEYLLLLDFDCAGGGRPTFFAGIGQVAQLRIV